MSLSLTSFEFKIKRDYIVMELAGMYHPEKCCVAIVVEGQDMRRISPDEFRNAWSSMDAREFEGKKGCLLTFETASPNTTAIPSIQIIYRHLTLVLRSIAADCSQFRDLALETAGKDWEATPGLRVQVLVISRTAPPVPAISSRFGLVDVQIASTGARQMSPT